MSPRTPPGETREKVFAYVRDRLLEGRPPTLREVQGAMGFRAVETVREHLQKLVDEGRLVKEPGRARGYALPTPPGSSRTRLVPVLGRVQAGQPVTAVEELEGYIPVAARDDGTTLFGLRVRGESMTGLGILPGDVVVVRAGPSARSGDLVVALVDDEATVKTLRLRGGRVELHPANPAFVPLVPDPSAVTILGKVIEVRRVIGAAAP
jgi:repressor LexA